MVRRASSTKGRVPCFINDYIPGDPYAVDWDSRAVAVLSGWWTAVVIVACYCFG